MKKKNLVLYLCISNRILLEYAQKNDKENNFIVLFYLYIEQP